MDEEEFVISSWQQSDFAKVRSGGLSGTMKLASKENIDVNAWLSQQEKEITTPRPEKSEEDILLDDETLTKLIEGDLKSDEEHQRKPKPTPRHNTRSSNSEDLHNKETADKLFSGSKEKADRLFSGTKDSADKLFSGEKINQKSDSVTSPRPVPRPRLKPASKENSSHEQSNVGSTYTNEKSESRKLSADKLFDSIGKNNKSVSFVDTNKDLTVAKKVSESKKSIEKNTSNERTPPRKSPRSKGNTRSPRKEKSSDESDSEQNRQKTPKDKKRPQPQQRNQDRKLSDSNNERTGRNSESRWSTEGMELFDGNRQMENSHEIRHQRNLDSDTTPHRGVKQKMHDVKDEKRSRWDTKEHENDSSRNSAEYSREKHERMQNSFRKDRSRKGNVTDMFEEHVPTSDGIVLGDEEGDKRNRHDRRPTGRESKERSPMKAHRGLDEMTKSPDLYSFKYESRDSPQTDTFFKGKGNLTGQRSASLTDLSSWKNTQFEKSHEDLESSSSGFASSRGIRDAVYAEWLEKKRGKLKDAVRKKVEEKQKEEEKIKEKQEKEILAKKAFEAWSTKKEEVIKTEIKKKKEIKEKELDVKREKIVKKQDAKKYFESWKSKKDEILKESYKEKKAKERDIKQMKIEDHKEKIEIAKKAYDKWKSRKEEQLKEEVRSARKGEKLKTKYEKEAENEKRQENEKKFQEFLRKKGIGKRAPPSPSLTQRAWCPGGLTKGTNLIPKEVQPVIAPPTLNRSRSFSGPIRSMTSFNGTKRLSRGW